MSDIITTLHPKNDDSVNLYPNIKKENIPDGSISQEKLGSDVNNILDGIDSQLAAAIASITQPKYYTTLPTSDKGLIVYSDGYLYSWNGTNYVSTGILYLSTGDVLAYKGELIQDLNNIKDLSIYFVTNPSLANKPSVLTGYLVTYHTSNMTLQNYLTHTGEYYVRRYYNNAWTSWKLLGDELYEKVNYNVLNDDLNNVKSNSVYLVSDSLANKPTTTSGILVTYLTIYETLQNYITHTGEYYVRRYTNAWSEWVLLSTTQEMKDSTYFNDGCIIKGYSEQNGYLNNMGNYDSTVNHHSKSYTRIPCKAGEKFIYRGSGRSATYSALFYNVYGSIIGRKQYNSPNTYTEVVIPESVVSVTFSSFDNIANDVILEVYKVNDLTINILNNSILSGKKWYVYGDSFTHGDFSGITEPKFDVTEMYANQLKVYPYFIGNRTHCIVYNEAVSGYTLTNDFVGSNRYQNIPADADYITLYFGINDSHQNIPIGTINDNTDDTFYGAWNIAIQWILENRPNAKLGVIISNGCDSIDYPVATINVCKKWGISYLDINGDETLPMVIRTNMRTNLSSNALNYWNSKYRVTTTNNHPNAKAHEDESYMIQQWLERL